MKKILEKFYKELEIYNINSKLERIGSKNDGGYVVATNLSKNINLLSFGVEDNFEFELDIQKYIKTKSIKLFDHTIKPIKNKNFKYFNKGLSDEKSANFTTLEQEITNLKNSSKNILKLDIEYDEWKIFEKINVNTLKKFEQIIVEFHPFFLNDYDVNSRSELSPYFYSFSKNNYKKINIELIKKYTKVIKKLNDNFILYHISLNNSLPLKKFYSFKVPQLIECSFIRKDKIKNRKIKKFKGKLPISGIDFPNKTDRPDIVNFYPFTKLLK